MSVVQEVLQVIGKETHEAYFAISPALSSGHGNHAGIIKGEVTLRPDDDKVISEHTLLIKSGECEIAIDLNNCRIVDKKEDEYSLVVVLKPDSTITGRVIIKTMKKPQE